MTGFTSKKERHIWALALLVLCTICASLWLAQSLASWLIDRDLINGVFGLGMIFVCGAIILVGFRARPSWPQIGVATGLSAIYIIIFARMAIPEERSHLIEYSVLALLIFEALRERQANGRTVWRPGLLAFLISSSIGVLDEVAQLFIPGRFFDVRDIIFNIIASLMAVAGLTILNRARN